MRGVGSAGGVLAALGERRRAAPQAQAGASKLAAIAAANREGAAKEPAAVSERIIELTVRPGKGPMLLCHPQHC